MGAGPLRNVVGLSPEAILCRSRENGRRRSPVGPDRRCAASIRALVRPCAGWRPPLAKLMGLERGRSPVGWSRSGFLLGCMVLIVITVAGAVLAAWRHDGALVGFATTCLAAEFVILLQGIGRRFGGPSRNWGSSSDCSWRGCVVGRREFLSEVGTESAIIDGATNLKQQIGAAS
jgi:hypothetical protein